MIIFEGMPGANDRFMPKKHGGLLSRLVTEAWLYNKALEDQNTALEVAEKLATWLEDSNPAADMEVLRRYGKTETVDVVRVRIYSPASERWDQSSYVEIPRSIEVATGSNNTSACSPRWSRVEGRGLKREKMTTEDYERAVAYQDDAEARMPPETIDPFFAALVEAREAYSLEYRASMDWPGSVKKKSGSYPLWREIEKKFPVLGAYVATVRAEESKNGR